MAQLNDDDRKDVERTLIPNGKYPAIIVQSGEKPNSKADGSYHQLVWQIVDGEQKDRKLWQNLNLRNPSKQAVEIARQQLTQIRRATGMLQASDTCELHNIPCIIDVRCEKRKGSEDMQNVIKNVHKKEAGSTAPETSGSAAPWAR